MEAVAGLGVYILAVMRLPLRVQYAICGSFDLAYNGGGAPVQIRVVSQRQAIPERYLEQVFQTLRRAGLIRGKPGPGGGYMLARPASEITLLSIVEALEGPMAESLAMEPAREGAETQFRPDFIWGALSEQLAETLAATDLEQLCREAARAELPRAQPDPPMYFI
jgi:Rrf2 family protein